MISRSYTKACIYNIYSKYNKLDLPSSKKHLHDKLSDNNDNDWF